MILERIYLALQQPATWYAIATGAGVFGVVGAGVKYGVRLWRGRRAGEEPGYARGFSEGARHERGRWADTVLCARDWSFGDIGDDGEAIPPHTLAEWVEHAQRRHGPFKYAMEQDHDAD